MKKRNMIILIVTLVCIVMGIIDAVLRPGYIVKSLVKLLLFLFLPVIYSFFDSEVNLKNLIKPSKQGILKALIVAVGVFTVILVSLLLKDVFDFSKVTSALGTDVGVNENNFLWVAIYISFVNSFLEEFFFRGFSFITLKKKTNRSFAYMFSALLFSLYHIAMMIGWFDFSVIMLAVAGLFVGGMIFNYFNEKNENIYMSWLIHMFANFAINTIGFMLFKII